MIRKPGGLLCKWKATINWMMRAKSLGGQMIPAVTVPQQETLPIFCFRFASRCKAWQLKEERWHGICRPCQGQEGWTTSVSSGAEPHSQQGM